MTHDLDFARLVRALDNPGCNLRKPRDYAYALSGMEAALETMRMRPRRADPESPLPEAHHRAAREAEAYTSELIAETEAFLGKSRAPVGPAYIAAVCAHHGITRDELLGPSKARVPSHARQDLVWRLIVHVPHLSLNQIAGIVGKRNHATILDAARRHSARVHGTAMTASLAEIRDAAKGRTLRGDGG